MAEILHRRHAERLRSRRSWRSSLPTSSGAAVALFDPVRDLLLVPERFRILHLLIESVV